MGLFSSLFGSNDSSSSSSSTVNNADKRLVVSDGLGITGDNNKTEFSYHVTDGGAIQSMQNVALSGLALAGQTVITNAETVDKELERMQELSTFSIGQSAQVAMDSMATVSNTALNALSFGSSVSRDAISLASQSSNSALDYGRTVSRDAMNLSDRAQMLIAQSAADSLGMVGHMADLALRQGADATEAVQQAVNQVGRAYDTATNYQAEKATTDSRYLVIAGIVAVALMAIKGFK